MTHFITIVTKNLDNAVDNTTFDTLLDLTYEKSYDQMKKMERESPQKLDLLFASHFSTKFLLDMLQFCFAYFVKAKGSHKFTEEEAKLKLRELYDHRTPVNLQKDGVETASLELEFVVKNFENITKAALESIFRIWKNPQNILKLWCIKFAEDPDLTRSIDPKKDSYDRTDNYDGQGVAVFVYLSIKQALDALFSTSSPAFLKEINPLQFLQFQNFDFLLENLIPSINFLIQDSISHPNSETLKQIGIELLTYLVCSSQAQISSTKLTKWTSVGNHTKYCDGALVLTSNLFKIMGDRNQKYLSPD